MAFADNLCIKFGPKSGSKLSKLFRKKSFRNAFGVSLKFFRKILSEMPLECQVDTPKAFLKEFFEKVEFERNHQNTEMHEQLPTRQIVKEDRQIHVYI